MKIATHHKELILNPIRIWVSKSGWVKKFKCRYRRHQKISSKCCEISFQLLQVVIAISNLLNKANCRECLKICLSNRCHISSVIDLIKQAKAFNLFWTEINQLMTSFHSKLTSCYKVKLNLNLSKLDTIHQFLHLAILISQCPITLPLPQQVMQLSKWIQLVKSVPWHLNSRLQQQIHS